MHLKPFLLVALVALAPVAEAQAEAGRRWTGGGDAESGWLAYGTPETDDLVVHFSCERAMRRLLVTYLFEPVVAEDGGRVFLEIFSVGVGEDGASVILPLEATGHRLLLDDAFLLEARTAWNPALRRLIVEGRELSIMVEDGVEELPLEGAAEQAAELFRACDESPASP